MSDAQLCRLYQKAGWSIYPSRYEGFGFPILDSLRHGTPVLSSCTSSLGEFDHPGVFFFDPQDTATVDLAWQRLQAARPITIPRATLDELYNWDLVAQALLDAHAQNGERAADGQRQSVQTALSNDGPGQGEEGPCPRNAPTPQKAASTRVKQNAGLRIGIELFGTQSASRIRGIGRYSRNLVAALLARDPANEYVLYGWDGLPTDHIPRHPTPSSACCNPTRRPAIRRWPT